MLLIISLRPISWNAWWWRICWGQRHYWMFHRKICWSREGPLLRFCCCLWRGRMHFCAQRESCHWPHNGRLHVNVWPRILGDTFTMLLMTWWLSIIATQWISMQFQGWYWLIVSSTVGVPTCLAHVIYPPCWSYFMCCPPENVSLWLHIELVHACGANSVASLLAGFVTCVMIYWCILAWIGQCVYFHITNLTLPPKIVVPYKPQTLYNTPPSITWDVWYVGCHWFFLNFFITNQKVMGHQTWYNSPWVCWYG